MNNNEKQSIRTIKMNSLLKNNNTNDENKLKYKEQVHITKFVVVVLVVCYFVLLFVRYSCFCLSSFGVQRTTAKTKNKFKNNEQKQWTIIARDDWLIGGMGEVLRGGQNEAIRSLRDKITDNEQRTTTITNTKNNNK